jgi:hypothetical protein
MVWLARVSVLVAACRANPVDHSSEGDVPSLEYEVSFVKHFQGYGDRRMDRLLLRNDTSFDFEFAGDHLHWPDYTRESWNGASWFNEDPFRFHGSYSTQRLAAGQSTTITVYCSMSNALSRIGVEMVNLSTGVKGTVWCAPYVQEWAEQDRQ